MPADCHSRSSQHGEQLEHARPVGRDPVAVAPGGGAEPQVVGDRQAREDAPALGGERDAEAHDALGRQAGDRRCRRSTIRPAAAGTRPATAPSSDDLPAPLAPSTVDDLALVDAQADAAERAAAGRSGR